MSSPYTPKRAGATLPFQIDMARTVLDGEIITDVEIEVTQGVTVDRITFTDELVQFWLAGGIAGRRAIISAAIFTSNGSDHRLELPLDIIA